MKICGFLSIILLIALTLYMPGCFYSVPKEFELGSIAGIAQDQNFKGLEGVQVTLVGTEKVSYTDATGTFFFSELEPASYTVSFFMQGFQTIQKNVTVQKGQSRTLMVEMVGAGGSTSQGLNGGPPTTSITNLQNQQNQANLVNVDGANVNMLYVANAGRPQVDQTRTGDSSVPYTKPGEMPDTSQVGGINVDTAMLYGADPTTQAYNNANNTLPNASKEEIQAYMQYSDKKKNNLMVINSMSRAAVSFIEWNPSVMPLWLAMSDNGVLFVADSSNNITILNTNSNNAITSTIPMGNYIVCDIAVGASGSRLYCALGSAGTPAVGVIDAMTNSYIKTISLPRMKNNSIGQPWGIAAQKNGQGAYVAVGTDTGGEVVFINTMDNSVQGSVTVGQNPFGLAVTPDGRKLYVANQNSANVSVVDTASRQVIGAPIGVGYSPVRVAVTPDGAKVIVTNKGGNSVSIIDTRTNTVISTLPVGKEPVGVAVSRDGKKAYVANSGSDNISIIDMASNSIVNNTIPFPGGRPFSVVVK